MDLVVLQWCIYFYIFEDTGTSCLKISSGNSIDQKLHVDGIVRVNFSLLIVLWEKIKFVGNVTFTKSILVIAGKVIIEIFYFDLVLMEYC